MSEEFEQMEFDLRLDSEISLEDNVTRMIQFVFDQQNAETKKSGSPEKSVKNKHEGYGIAAEAWSKIQLAEKDIKNGMNDYLGRLQVSGDPALDAPAKLYKAATTLAINAINMAVDTNRILSDLYYGDNAATPIEEMDAALNAQEGEDGFLDAEAENLPDADAEAENAGENDAEEGDAE